MPEHNINPQEIADREDLASLLTSPSAGDWQVETWDAVYVVAEGEHDTARLYGTRHDGIMLDAPNPSRFRDIERARNFCNSIAAAATRIGAAPPPMLIRMQRQVTLIAEWVSAP